MCNDRIRHPFHPNRWARFFGIFCLAAAAAACGPGQQPDRFQQEPLPYAETALEPYISAETMGVHYGKHHAGYVRAANRLAAGGAFRGPDAGRDYPYGRGQPGACGPVQQCRPGMEPRFFLEVHETRRRGGGRPARWPLKSMKPSAVSMRSKGNFSRPPPTGSAAAGYGWCWTAENWQS